MKIFKQKVLFILLGLTVFLFFLSLVLFYFNSGRLTAPLILHFDAFRGVDLFGEKTDFFGVWLLGLASAILNAVLAETFFYRERILTYIFLAMNVLFGILVLVFTAVVIRVN